MVNLRPMLSATLPAWKANLDRLFERMQFILGEQVENFESELASAFGAKFAVAVGTGTAAIELSLRAAGLSGSEILVPVLTSPFTAQAVLAAGCRIRFADVDAKHLLLDASYIGKKTKAMLPVHLYGQPCEVAGPVHDACQAHGARVFGRPLTRAAKAVAYSFYPTKNLPCLGDGGAVLTDSRALAAKVRALRDGGRRNDQVSRIPAFNSRLDEMQACYLRAFLPKLEEWNAERVWLAGLYDRALAECGLVRPVARRDGSVCHLYVVRTRKREALREFLAKHGIMTGVHYPMPLHMQPAFRDARGKRGDFPVAERACREILSLPLWPYMPESVVEEVAGRILEFAWENGETSA